MKIYIKDLPINHNQQKALLPYYINKKHSSMIYSEEGIFKIEKDKLYKMKINDIPIRTYNIDNIVLYMDDSKINIDEEWYQIPYNHYNDDIIEEIYKLKPTSTLQMSIIKKNSFIQDIYFVTKYDINTIGLKDDIFSFLSLLKFNSNM